MAQKTEQRLLNELRRVLDNTGSDLARVELLTAALASFSRPVPDYEPRFHHFGARDLSNHELRQRNDR